jgi:hypothetical protein
MGEHERHIPELSDLGSDPRLVSSLLPLVILNTDTLASSIGDAAMTDLLTVPSLFIDVGNNCLSQLTGVPIFELGSLSTPLHKKRHAADTLRESRLKRPRVGNTATLVSHKPPSTKREPRGTAKNNSAADIYIRRITAFYAKPMRRPNGRVYVGLPKYRM